MVAPLPIYAEHTRSRNIEAPFRGNQNTIDYTSFNATFRENHKTIVYPQLQWFLHVLNILGPEIWKPLLEEIIIL